jgi:WD40 repeat protein
MSALTFTWRTGLSQLAVLLTWMTCQADPPTASTLQGHRSWVAAVSFSPDGKRLVSASADRTAITWLLPSGKPDQVLTGHRDYVSTIVGGAQGVLVTGSYDGTVRLWRPGKTAEILDRRRGAVMAVALSADGKRVAVGGLDGVITFMDIHSRKNSLRLLGHKTWVNSLSFDAKGVRLASGSSDGTARLWDPQSGKTIRIFTLDDPREIRSVALSPDGKLLAAGLRFGAVKVWETSTGSEVINLRAHQGDAWAVCFTPDGKTLITGGGDWGKPGTVRLWLTKDWKAGLTLSHPSEVLCVAVSPQGRWIAAAGSGKTISLWDLGAKK